MSDPGGCQPPENRYVNVLAGGDGLGAVTLVGVVHDHPASIQRVRRVVRGVSPDVLALELPPLAVPFYEAHAAGNETPPALGGEFSAAVQAAATDDVVGIDGPSLGFARSYLRRLAHERASPRQVGRALRSLVSAGASAAVRRAAAWVTRRTALRVGVGGSVPHGTSWTDQPDVQAADESRELRSAIAVRDAFEPPRPSKYRSEARERYMTGRLATLRERGDVVAVIGAGHFAPLSEALGSPD